MAIVAVATGHGLSLGDVSDPASPQLPRNVNTDASAVQVFDGIAYLAADSSSSIKCYSLQPGEMLQVLTLAGSIVTGLAREAQALYAMDAGRVLRMADASELDLVARGAQAFPSGNGQLFVGNGVAHVAADDGNTGGFATVDVAHQRLQLRALAHRHGLGQRGLHRCRHRRPATSISAAAAAACSASSIRHAGNKLPRGDTSPI